MRFVGLLMLPLAIVGCNRRQASVRATPQPVMITQVEPVSPPSPAKRIRRPPPPSRPPEAVVRTTAPPMQAVTTPEEKQAILQQIKVSVARAESNLSALRSKQMNGTDAHELGRVRSFLRQAQTAEESKDLVTARLYAQRAEVLSLDLLNR